LNGKKPATFDGVRRLHTTTIYRIHNSISIEYPSELLKGEKIAETT